MFYLCRTFYVSSLAAAHKPRLIRLFMLSLLYEACQSEHLSAAYRVKHSRCIIRILSAYKIIYRAVVRWKHIEKGIRKLRGRKIQIRIG